MVLVRELQTVFSGHQHNLNRRHDDDFSPKEVVVFSSDEDEDLQINKRKLDAFRPPSPERDAEHKEHFDAGRHGNVSSKRRRVSDRFSDVSDEEDEHGAPAASQQVAELETCRVDNAEVSIPRLLSQLDLKDILNMDVWSGLSEQERSHLTALLPKHVQQNPESTLNSLFQGSNFHFGNPLHRFQRNLQSGLYRPDIVKVREQALKLDRRQYRLNIREYHSEMIDKLCRETDETFDDIWRQIKRQTRIAKKQISNHDGTLSEEASIKIPDAFVLRSLDIPSRRLADRFIYDDHSSGESTVPSDFEGDPRIPDRIEIKAEQNFESADEEDDQTGEEDDEEEEEKANGEWRRDKYEDGMHAADIEGADDIFDRVHARLKASGQLDALLEKPQDDDPDFKYPPLPQFTGPRFSHLRAQKNQLTIQPSTPEVRKAFRRQERERYQHPEKMWVYDVGGVQGVVAPVIKKGIAGGSAKAREHFMLKPDRPPYITILSLVRDAASRLPDGVGTRADVCEMLRDSQYIVDVADAQINNVVSGALDRLHYEADPCVRFDVDQKLWIYLHRGRKEEDFKDWGKQGSTRPKRSKNRPDDKKGKAAGKDSHAKSRSGSQEFPGSASRTDSVGQFKVVPESPGSEDNDDMSGVYGMDSWT